MSAEFVIFLGVAGYFLVMWLGIVSIDQDW
jgi:hypothetical protein